MSKNIGLRLKYVELIQQGKDDEAFNILKEIWELNSKNPVSTKQEGIEEVKIVEQSVEKEEFKFSKISELTKIKGIGKETVKDIECICPTIESLVETLRSDKDIPLRNDIVKKLHKEFNI